MTVTVANVDIDADTFLTWSQKTNQLADAMSNEVVTVGSAGAVTGNVYITGSTQSNALYLSTGLYGGTIGATANLSIQTVSAFNSNVNMSNTGVHVFFNGPETLHIEGSNTTHRFISVDSSTGVGAYKQALTVGTGAVVAIGDAEIDGTFTANVFSGNGTSITTLNADELSTGTVPSARISGSYTGITGVGTIAAGTWQGSSISTTYTAAKVTSVTGGSGLTGGTTGAVTLNIGQGTGIVVSADSISVNSSYIATISANNSTYLNNQAASYYTNASNLSTGTVPSARLSGSYAINISGSAATATSATTATNSTYANTYTGTSNPLSSVYTGSSATNTNYPIGTTILVNNTTNHALNDAVTIYIIVIAGKEYFYDTDTGGLTALTGTWRCRGGVNVGAQLFQRVA